MKKSIYIPLAILIIILIRFLLIEMFSIPTSAMENSVLRGDWILVFKNPLGVNSPKRNDIYTFHYPGNPDRPDPYGGISQNSSISKRTPYVKRVIGLPGEHFEIKNGDVFINGKLIPAPNSIKKYYLLKSKTEINLRVFEKFGISVLDYQKVGDEIFYRINASKKGFDQLKNIDFVISINVEIIEPSDLSMKAIPHLSTFNNNRDNIEKFIIPKKGLKIILNESNSAFYKIPILFFDNNKNATFYKGKILIDGQPINQYTFNQDHFFMMGDNRSESDDSRFWGLVPNDHLIGKAELVFMSIEKEGLAFKRIRWERIFTLIL